MPDKHFKQTRIRAKMNDHWSTVVFDTGAEVSIINLDFARKIGAEIDTDRTLDCIGVGGSVYSTEGFTRVKITIGQELVYEFGLWVGDLQDSATDAILGMDFMVPAEVRLDVADGSACMPNDVRVRFEGRRQLFTDRQRLITLRDQVDLQPGESWNLRVFNKERQQLWICRGENWVTTVHGSTPRWIKIVNVSARAITLPIHEVIGMWMNKDHIPRKPYTVMPNSNRASEWRTLAYQATSDLPEAEDDAIPD